MIHFKGDVMDVYRPSSLPQMVNVINRWTMIRIGQEPDQGDQVCTIREVELVVVSVVSNADPPQEEIMPTKILPHPRASPLLEKFLYLGRHYLFLWWICV